MLKDLDIAFSIQISRIKASLFPPSHSIGSRKPDLEEQEAQLLKVPDVEDEE